MAHRLGNLLLISVGTARYHAGYKAENIVNMAPALQGLASLQSLMDDDAQVNQMMLQWLTLCLTPWVLDRELGDMKTDSEKGPRLATYARFDALLDHDWLSQNLGVDWTDAQISDAAQMDKPENMKMVAELGRLAADRQAGASAPAVRSSRAEAGRLIARLMRSRPVP